jgi:hypothetical protein
MYWFLATYQSKVCGLDRRAFKQRDFIRVSIKCVWYVLLSLISCNIPYLSYNSLHFCRSVLITFDVLPISFTCRRPFDRLVSPFHILGYRGLKSYARGQLSRWHLEVFVQHIGKFVKNCPRWLQWNEAKELMKEVPCSSTLLLYVS